MDWRIGHTIANWLRPWSGWYEESEHQCVNGVWSFTAKFWACIYMFLVQLWRLLFSASHWTFVDQNMEFTFHRCFHLVTYICICWMVKLFQTLEKEQGFLTKYTVLSRKIHHDGLRVGISQSGVNNFLLRFEHYWGCSLCFTAILHICVHVYTSSRRHLMDQIINSPFYVNVYLLSIDNLYSTLPKCMGHNLPAKI